MGFVSSFKGEDYTAAAAAAEGIIPMMTGAMANVVRRRGMLTAGREHGLGVGYPKLQVPLCRVRRVSLNICLYVRTCLCLCVNSVYHFFLLLISLTCSLSRKRENIQDSDFDIV